MRAIGLPITVVLVAVLCAAIRLPLSEAHLEAKGYDYIKNAYVKKSA
jgi:hypothetical protein